MNKVQIGKDAHVNIKWRVRPMDYSRAAEADIADRFADKYGIDKANVSVEPVYVGNTGGNNEDAFINDAAQNIQDPTFQQGLFKKYIEEFGVDGCDFDKILEIDSIANSFIDYEQYDKHKKYDIKWVRWSNFMSYGEDNYVDMSKLNGMVLLTSEPANQGGKSTFCIDLFRFLLFGKVTSRENDWTLSKAFNRHTPEATEVNVEGCVSIDGVDYIIRRTLSRPELKRRSAKSKVTQKIEYYKIVNGEYVELADDGDNENEVNGRETNKMIKEAIGNERDFDLMICVNSDNLKGLISLKDADRGRLISRWIGLLPLEEKDKKAREYYNRSVAPKLLMNKYNKEELAIENRDIEADNDALKEEGIKKNNERAESEKKIKEYREKRDIYLQSKIQIDEEIAGIDKATVEASKKRYTDEGMRKAEEKKRNEKSLAEIGDVAFNEDEYREKVSADKKLSIEENQLQNDIRRLKNEVVQLEKGEFCPTCGAKLKGVDNSAAIDEKNAKIEEKTKRESAVKALIESIAKEISGMEENRKKYNEKLRLELIIEKNDVDIDNLRTKLRECNRILKELDRNDEAIRKNNDADAHINLIDASIKEEESIKRESERAIETIKATILSNRKTISQNKEIISKIEEEEKLVRNWKVYLDMVGKNGISKMVIRSALPLINGELSRLLADVCNFSVEIVIDDHNDVAFHLIDGDTVSELGSGSGFEQTVASLALRSVLSKISTFSKPSFVVFDEILGGVADENYDNIKALYDKIISDYKFILEISHLKAIVDWHQTQIIVKKNKGISSIEVSN